jgi:hypothetical protein
MSRRASLARRSRPNTAVNSCAVRFPWLSLGGAHLLVEGVRIGLSVLDSVEVLAVDVGERRTVAGVAEEQVEDRPDEGEAAALAREAADHFGASADLAKRSLEEIG